MPFEVLRLKSKYINISQQLSCNSENKIKKYIEYWLVSHVPVWYLSSPPSKGPSTLYTSSATKQVCKLPDLAITLIPF